MIFKRHLNGPHNMETEKIKIYQKTENSCRHKTDKKP